MDDFWTFIVNALLFYLAFKLGQITVWTRIGMNNRDAIQQRTQQATVSPLQRPVITVEEINGVFYAYDGVDFLAQGTNPDELGRLIANRFPNKYSSARIQIKA